MRNLLLGLIALIILNFAYTSATERKEKEKASLHPYELTLSGVLREVEDVYNSMPPIRVLVQADTVTITVGATKRYYYRYNELGSRTSSNTCDHRISLGMIITTILT